MTDATVTPTLVAVSGHSIQGGRRSVMLVASEPADGWLNLEWHWVRTGEEEAIPSGAARIAIDGLANASLGGDALFDREDVVSLVTDMALDAMSDTRREQNPVTQISRFQDVSPSALLYLRIDPSARRQLAAIRKRTRLQLLRQRLDDLLGVDVELMDYDD